MTVREQVLALKSYQQFEVIYPGAICKRMGVDRKAVDQACITLVGQSLMVRNPGGGYKKPQKHWIHTSRLCDHEGLNRARLSA